MYVRIYVYTYVRMYVRMYVCTYVCIFGLCDNGKGYISIMQYKIILTTIIVSINNDTALCIILTFKNCSVDYGTARFKLEARVRVTRMYFVAPLEYFSKSCVSVDNCTRISQAIHARMTSPNMLAYVHAWTHVTMHAHSLRNFDHHQ